MWILRWLSVAVISLIVLGFAFQNLNRQVSVVFITGMYETGPLPIWVIVYASFALGMVFWLCISVFQVLALKSQVRKMRNENTRIRKELDNLRNLSIEDEIEIKALPADTTAGTN